MCSSDLDGGGSLEFVVDLHAQTPPSLSELGPHVGLPLGRVSFDLPHLERSPRRDVLTFYDAILVLIILNLDTFTLYKCFTVADAFIQSNIQKVHQHPNASERVMHHIQLNTTRLSYFT